MSVLTRVQWLLKERETDRLLAKGRAAFAASRHRDAQAGVEEALRLCIALDHRAGIAMAA